MMHYPLDSLKYTPDTEFFFSEGKYKGEYLPNCGVIATSLATNIPYMEVREAYAENKRKPNAWKGRLFEWEVDNCLIRLSKAHGFDIEKCTDYQPFGVRVVEFAELHSRTGQSYILHVCGHFLAVKNGWIGDQYGIEHYTRWKTHHRYGRNSLAKEVWIIENGGVSTPVAFDLLA